MLFKEFGNPEAPTTILLHGGGLSWWSLKNVASLLKPEYHVVTPIIDGHGEDADETFISIEKSAEKLVEYIGSNCGGKVFALGGLSLGAQIVVEALSTQADIADYAIIESALVYPMRGTKTLMVTACQISYWLIKNRWFSKLQAKALCVPNDMFEEYYSDSVRMSKQSLVNIVLSNGTYELKDEIRNTKAKALIIVGEKEGAALKKSATKLHQTIPHSKLYTAPKMKHGEMSLVHSERYVELLKEFFNFEPPASAS